MTKEGREWVQFWSNSRKFQDAEIIDIMETPLWRGRQSSLPLYQENSTFHALEKLVINKAHRVAVLASPSDNRSK